MSFRIALRGFFEAAPRLARPRGRAAARPGRRRPPGVAAVELLEPRGLLTAYVVDTLADAVAADGKVSLREAVRAASADLPVNEAAAGEYAVADTITFAASLDGGTITLGGTDLAVDGLLVVDGPGRSRLTIDGDDFSRVFTVNVGADLTVSGLTVARGDGIRAGGGFYNGGGRLTVSGCAVVASDADFGGGIYSSGILTVTDCLVEGNTAGYGAGIYVLDGSAEIVGTTVSGNTITGARSGGGGFGGGIYSGGEMRLLGVTVSGNAAPYGAGVAHYGTTLDASNVTVSGNSATASGGGLYVANAAATLRNVTLFGNRSDADGDGDGTGGGLYSLSAWSVVLFNTIAAGNGRGAGAASDVAGALGPRSGHNVIGDAATAGGLANGVNGNVVGVVAAGLLDPSLADNGGPTKTHRLLPGSAAVDAGDDAQALDPDGRPLATDQRGAGFGRRKGSHVDAGAFEADPGAPASGPKADLIGYLSGGWYVGASSGSAFTTSRWAQWSGAAWAALRQGDFDGDGRTDVLGLIGGAWYVGVSTGAAFVTGRWGAWSAAAWKNVLVGDLNGDGKDDVLASAGGAWYAALSTGSGFAAAKLWAGTADAAWTQASLADVTGDGKEDLVLRLGGAWYVAASTGSAFNKAALWATWSDAAWAAGLADLDGDGRLDVYGLLGGTWYVGRSTGAGFATSLRAAWNGSGWKDVVAADFDGDGRADLAARLGGQWWVGLSNPAGGQGAAAYWGSWSDAVWRDVRAGDFDGDGRADLAGRLNGRWYVARSTGGGFATGYWGAWKDADWQAVGAADATGSAAAASGGGAVQAAPSGTSPALALRLSGSFAPVRTSDDPLVLFWSQAGRDEELSRGLLVGAV